ncbi:hypothetical protein K402DRAFT_458328 [Aulographum hederae CBS 113979]|uniref:Uncharacterized protein n=1 Tax=Aulographum hederae CBS 113979 TaxID=1176131 RepID=A0A6G1GK03_9PEZI|nr:hypothetical protein K402DRAFT_458328 [Aulographum hederae CBS 113979]
MSEDPNTSQNFAVEATPAPGSKSYSSMMKSVIAMSKMKSGEEPRLTRSAIRIETPASTPTRVARTSRASPIASTKRAGTAAKTTTGSGKKSIIGATKPGPKPSATPIKTPTSKTKAKDSTKSHSKPDKLPSVAASAALEADDNSRVTGAFAQNKSSVGGPSKDKTQGIQSPINQSTAMLSDSDSDADYTPLNEGTSVGSSSDDSVLVIKATRKYRKSGKADKKKDANQDEEMMDYIVVKQNEDSVTQKASAEHGNGKAKASTIATKAATKAATVQVVVSKKSSKVINTPGSLKAANGNGKRTIEEPEASDKPSPKKQKSSISAPISAGDVNKNGKHTLGEIHATGQPSPARQQPKDAFLAISEGVKEYKPPNPYTDFLGGPRNKPAQTKLTAVTNSTSGSANSSGEVQNTQTKTKMTTKTNVGKGNPSEKKNTPSNVTANASRRVSTTGAQSGSHNASPVATDDTTSAAAIPTATLPASLAVTAPATAASTSTGANRPLPWFYGPSGLSDHEIAGVIQRTNSAAGNAGNAGYRYRFAEGFRDALMVQGAATSEQQMDEIVCLAIAMHDGFKYASEEKKKKAAEMEAAEMEVAEKQKTADKTQKKGKK